MAGQASLGHVGRPGAPALGRRLAALRAGRWRGAGLLAALGGTLVTTVIIGATLRVGRVPNISLLYLFPVVAVARTWGRAPAVVAALLAFLSFDWFFVQPYHTFTVDDPAEWLALGVLLLAALYTAQLTAALRQQAQEAQRRDWEATTLRTLASTLAAARDLPELLALAQQEASRIFACQACRIALAPAAPPTDAPDALALPLCTPSGTVGAIQLLGLERATPLDREIGPLLHAFAAQLALAIERLRLQEEATQAEVLRRSDELRSALLSAVSHDLRTPLAAIKAAATSLLQRDVAWSEAEREAFARSIDAGTDRLNRLVTNLLDLSRIEAGALHPALEEYLLEDLIGEAVGQARALFAPGQLRVALPDDAATLPWVRVDPILVEQVLINLLDNAAKYSPPGRPVTIRAATTQEAAVLAVEDQGPGIPPEERERVFERFYRLAGPNRPGGTGLGLAVCKGIVEAHGGRIWVEAGPGGGTVVAFTLPAALTSGEAG